MAEVREGVAISANNLYDKKLSQVLEEAMAAEVTACYAEGVMDPEVIKVRMLAAKEQAKYEYNNPKLETE